MEDGETADSMESSPSPAEETCCDDKEGEKDPPKVLTAAELLMQREEKTATKKESISVAVSQLMEDPEGNVRMSDIPCVV